MSTYCIRIIEYQQTDGTWAKCGSYEDNYHGFDSWQNEKFRDRGFPADATVTKESLAEPDGRLYSWGHSYITLQELSEWCKEEKQSAMAYMMSTIQNSKICKIEERLAAIEARLDGVPKQERKDGKEEDEYSDEYLSPMDRLDLFTDMVDESMQFYEGLSARIDEAYNAVIIHEHGLYWPDINRCRILFYFE